MDILFICTGNICRSPIAERLAKAESARIRIEGISASSAGTHAAVGQPIHPKAIAVLDRYGADTSGFAARRLTPKVTATSDLILTMTVAHRDAVLQLAPQKLHRTYTLVEAARLVDELNAQTLEDLSKLRPMLAAQPSDIDDPIGQSADVFYKVGERIASLIPPIIQLCGRSVRPDEDRPHIRTR